MRVETLKDTNSSGGGRHPEPSPLSGHVPSVGGAPTTLEDCGQINEVAECMNLTGRCGGEL